MPTTISHKKALRASMRNQQISFIYLQSKFLLKLCPHIIQYSRERGSRTCITIWRREPVGVCSALSWVKNTYLPSNPHTRRMGNNFCSQAKALQLLCFSPQFNNWFAFHSSPLAWIIHSNRLSFNTGGWWKNKIEWLVQVLNTQTLENCSKSRINTHKFARGYF